MHACMDGYHLPSAAMLMLVNGWDSSSVTYQVADGVLDGPFQSQESLVRLVLLALVGLIYKQATEDILQ